MNPYLEQPELWHQVHNRLVVAIADDLTPQIVPKFRVSIEERVYTSVSDALLVGIADVAVSRRDFTTSKATMTASQLAEPTKVKVPMPEEVTERFLEVRSTQSGAVISVIEVLSPKNKRSREGRDAYESKRQKILGSTTSLVEIDLLRGGKPMPVLGEASTGYRILVSRGYRRPEADLYTFGLKDPISAFPVPLNQGEPEPVVDLQKLLNEVYERARFDLAIDYSQPVKPPLPQEEEAWVAELLGRSESVALLRSADR
jgi:hypothetical protein